jgi:hypothetical protein
VLIVDNLRMAHVGMPGFGERELRALITNPVRMSYQQEGRGLLRPARADDSACLGERIEDFRAARRSSTPVPDQALVQGP